jgi:hypothetical protein
MNKRICFVIALLTSIALTGCKGEEEAREYAKGLIDILKAYQGELEAKAGAEQKAYKSLAKIYGEAADNDLLSSLSTERRERGDRLADLALTGKAPTNTALKDFLKEYASRETESTRELLFRESDNYDKYLSTLNKLSIDGDSIEAAIKALETLTKKPSLIQELKFLREYGASAKSCLDEMLCKSLAAELKAAEESLSDPNKVLPNQDEEKKRKEVLTSTINELKLRQKSTSCEKNPTCPKSNDKTPNGSGK